MTCPYASVQLRLKDSRTDSEGADSPVAAAETSYPVVYVVGQEENGRRIRTRKKNGHA